MLFGLPIEVVTMLGSSLFSGLMTMWSQKSENEAKLMRQLASNREQYYQAQEVLTKTDKTFSWTRRFIALTIVIGALIMVFAPAIFHIPTLVQTEIVNSYLFGLITDKEIVHNMVKAFVIPEWWSSAFTAVVGLYFGSSMVKK